MGDLKTNWTDPALGDMGDLGGQLPTSRGTDPLVNTGGSSGLQAMYSQPGCPTPGGEASSRTLSGLPADPQRFQPAETPPQPPNLKDRNPGTVG